MILIENEKRAVSKKRMGVFVVAVIVIVMLALGYYYTAGQDTGTDSIIVAVRGYLSVEQKEALTEQFNGYSSQEEGEGISLRVFEFPAANSDAGNSETSRMFSQLMNEIKSGASDLMLLDSYVFDMLGDETLFEDLSVRYSNDPAVSGKYLYAISGKPFANASGLEELPEVFLALRSAQLGVVNKNALSLEKYSQQSELLDNIANSTPPEGYAAKGMKK